MRGKETLMRMLFDIDVAQAEGSEYNPERFKEVTYYKGFVDTFIDDGGVKRLFNEFMSAYGLFLEAKMKSDWEGMKLFSKEIKTILQLLRSRIIEHLQKC